MTPSNVPGPTGFVLSPVSALLAEMVRRYIVMGQECGLLEVHKLAWLLHRAAECEASHPLGLHAQTSQVQVDNAKQSQSGGLGNTQRANIGNASGDGKSQVNLGNLKQTQNGLQS